MWSRWLDSARGFEKRICHHFSQGSCYIKSTLKDSDVFKFPQNSGWFGNCGHCVGGGERPANLLCWIWVTTTPHEHVNQFGILINPYDNMMGSVPMKININHQKGRPEISTLHLLASNWLIFTIFDPVLIGPCLDLAPKVYVCPPNFVLDHDWLAIPKVTTVCRVSLLKSAQI